MGNAKRERQHNKVHAIGASRQVTAFPLLGLVEKEKNSNFAGVPREQDFLPEALRVSHVYIGAWGAYLKAFKKTAGTTLQTKVENLIRRMHPLGSCVLHVRLAYKTQFVHPEGFWGCTNRLRTWERPGRQT